MKRFLSTVLFLVACISAAATEYGVDRAACRDCYYVTSGVVTVRKSPKNSAGKAFTAYGGDVFYVDSEELFEDSSGAQWIRISGDMGYVPLRGLTRQDNPNYVAPQGETPLTFTAPLWLKLALLAVFLLYCVLFFWLFRYRWGWIKPFFGIEDKNGMRKILFYNSEPYVDCLMLVVVFLFAFVSTFLLFIIIGGGTLGLAWVVRILADILIWVLIIGGILGGLWACGHAFSKDEVGGCLAQLAWFSGGVFAVWLGIQATGWTHDVYDFGSRLVFYGDNVYEAFSVFEIAWILILKYWKYALLVAFIPIVVLGVCGLGFMLFNGALILAEKATMRAYNVKNPCPNCGKPSEPAIYYSQGSPLPVKLMPGRYGVFFIDHPVTGEDMPTRMRHGKALLERECPHCHKMIKAEMGEEKHVAFAGLSGSGKTTLMFRLMARALDRRVGSEPVARFTDSTGPDDRRFKRFYEEIKGGKRMERFPESTTRGRHKALQVLVSNTKSLMPYRMYFNDLAGEMFTADKNEVSDAPFLKNTDVVLFCLDPTTMKTSGLRLSQDLKDWFLSKGINPAENNGRVDINSAVDRLLNMIANYRGKEGARKIDLIVNFVKTDEGYLGKYRSSDQAHLRAFMEDAMGLGNVLVRLEQAFRKVSFFAVSAMEAAETSNVDSLLDSIFDGLGISFKGVKEEELRKNRMDSEKLMKEREDAAANAVKDGAPAVLGALISAVVVLVLVVGWLIYDGRSKNSNYDRTVVAVERYLEEPNGYDNALNCIDAALSGKRLSSKQREQLNELRQDVVHGRQNYVDGLVTALDANVTAARGRMSNLEMCAKNQVLDPVRNFRTRLEELEAFDPGNADAARFRSELERLLNKYHISLDE